MATLFISDLHLDATRPAVSDCLLRFLSDVQGHAQALYILGDLFEAWVGDDHPEPAYRPVKLALQACVRAGTPVFLLRGNRDFLLGEQFCTETGCTLLADPSVIDLYGTPTLLMHGDSLCTDDVPYQALRARLRDPAWQRQARSLPLEDRLQMAEQARELSVLAGQGKAEAIMDVNQAQVLRVVDQHAVKRLIHGHTHRPAIHALTHRGQTLQRAVLGDWYRQGSVLSVSADGLELRALPL